MPRRLTVISGCLASLLLVAFVPLQLDANHSWSGFHWDGSALPVGVTVGDNVTSEWGGHLDAAVVDWNNPTGGAARSIALAVTNGLSDRATCSPTIGRIEVCNYDYGDNNWLGLAQVWAYRGKDKHIAQATTLLNDFYFNDPYYDTPSWRQLVMCQEIAHDFGLDHQDETFDNYNLGTCMDYTSDPDGGGSFGPSNTAPNQHDFDQIAETYAHIGGSGGGGRGGGGGGGGGGGRRGGGAGQSLEFPDLPPQAFQRVPIDSPAQWGRLIRDSGRSAIYELDLGNDMVLFTFVTWAQ